LTLFKGNFETFYDQFLKSIEKSALSNQ